MPTSFAWKTVIFMFSLSILSSASAAAAAITWNVKVSNLEGGPFILDPYNTDGLGRVAVLDITMRSDSERTFALGASIFGYHPGEVVFVGGTTSTNALVEIPVGPGTGWGGLHSRQVVPEVNPRKIQFFEGLSVLGTTQTGALDLGAVSGESGGAQFRIELSFPEYGATVRIGSDPAFGDAAVGAGGQPLVSNNAEVRFWEGNEPRITQLPFPPNVPEPSAALLIGLGLAGLARRPRANVSLD